MAPQSCEELEGEVDIETIPVNEVEVRLKDLLPVFDNSRVVHQGSRVPHGKAVLCSGYAKLPVWM